MKLAGKVAIVTGGGTGIGLGISRSLAEAGAAVVIAQRREEKAEAAAEALRAEGHKAIGLSINIRYREQVLHLLETTLNEFGRLDILVNNAALVGSSAAASFLECTDEKLTNVIDVNLKGTFICSQEAARQMVKQGTNGAIIHITSVGGFAAQEFASVYCATKFGVEGLTKAMALELAPYNIRVNSIAPGDVVVETSENVLKELQEMGATGKYARLTPLGRRGRPEELGPAAVFLASEDASFITGSSLLVDGGFLTY